MRVRGVAMLRLAVKEYIRAECFQEGPLVHAAEKQLLVDADSLVAG